MVEQWVVNKQINESMNKPVTALQDVTKSRNLGASIQVALILVRLWTDESRKSFEGKYGTSY